MKFLVLQHLAVEHPGVFRDFLAEDGFDLFTVELDQGQAIPPLEDFDAMMVMGGPQDTWLEDEFPWLKAEKAAISERVLHGGCYPSPKKLAAGIQRRTKHKTRTAHTQGGVNRRGVVYVLEKGASCDLSRLSLRTGKGIYTINSATGVVSLSR